MTVSRAADFGAHALRERPDSRVDALRLLERALDRGRGWIVANGEAALGRESARRYLKLLREARGGMPLAYVLGETGFYRRALACDRRALVPRPETELLVERALQLMQSVATPLVLDVGTGTGAIACAIAAERDDVAVVATDISRPALALAQHNAERLGVAGRCRFLHADLVEPTVAFLDVPACGYDAVLANLPYVPSGDIPVFPQALAFEPRQALDGGADGLALYRRFVPLAPPLLKPGGVLLLEAAPPQMPGLVSIASQAFPDGQLRVGRDLGGLERYVEVRTAAG